MRSFLLTVLLFGCLCGVARADWLTDTLAFQDRLGDPLPLVNATWLGTHNSFNTTTEPQTLSGSDPNQKVSMADQLTLGMRSLELDVHWFPSAFAGGAYAPVVCHARGEDEGQAGCSSERLLDARLTEIRGWLDAHPDAFLLLYIEDALGGQPGHDAAAAMLSNVLGDKLYKPPGGGASCEPMPLGTSRAQMRAAGAQVLAISHCGPGGAWQGLVFDDKERSDNEDGVPDAGYDAYPSCDPDPERSLAFYDQHFIRYFEDSTRLSATVSGPSDGLTAPIVANMVRCGVDLFGFDQMAPGDPRLDAAVWTWVPGAPRRTGCTAERASDGRWRVALCKRRLPVACVKDGVWGLGGRRPYGRARCGKGSRFAVPRTGEDGAKLQAALQAAGVKRAWVRHRVR